MRRTKTMLMGDLLDEFFKRPYVAAKVAEGKLPDTWREIVGDRVAELTTELRLEKHILHVRIQSSVVRSELFYQREALKEEINRRSGVQLVNAVIIRCPEHAPTAPGQGTTEHAPFYRSPPPPSSHPFTAPPPPHITKKCSPIGEHFLKRNFRIDYLMITERLAFWLFL